MYSESRPLEMLTAFAICFVSGVLSAAALGAYTGWMKRKSGKSDEMSSD